MEIGGYDTVIRGNPSTLSSEIMDFIGWNESVIEKDEGQDFFYYKDQASKDAWDEDVGPDDTMIYFIFGDNELSVVADKETTDKIRNRFMPV